MKKGFIIAAVVLVVVGLAVAAAVYAASGFSFGGLSGEKLVSKTYAVGEGIDSIRIKAYTDDIAFVPTEDGSRSVVCLESEELRHSVTEEGGPLVITVEDERSWTDRLMVFRKTPRITVYLPAGEYDSLDIETSTGDVVIPGEFSFESIRAELQTGDIDCAASAAANVAIRTTTGDIRVRDMSCGELELSVTTGHIAVGSARVARLASVKFSTGDVRITGMTAMSFRAKGSTGDITLKDVVTEGDTEIEVSTGDVVFESSDAGSLAVKTSTGDVTGTLRTEKVFITKTSTGRVNVPGTSSGGRCEITTTTGDIAIRIG